MGSWFGDLEGHVHLKDISCCIELCTDQSPNQNAGTISKQKHKRAMSFGWTLAFNGHIKGFSNEANI